MKAINSDRILSRLRKFGKVCIISLMMFMVYLGGNTNSAIASPTTEVVNVSLGNPAGELKFFPDHLELTTGQSYKLVLKNPSPIKHYFTAKDFADGSWTRKVQVGKVEIKGAIHELELKPGGEAEWVITPMKSGTYELYCSVSGHKEAGMKGEIVVK